MTKVDYKYTLASFFTNRFNLARSIGSFAKKPYEPHPVLDDKNSYVGYYEIDDIMSFSDSILERTRKNNKR
jgi:hypothetical protein